jgi:ELWxxDGT repeat protein
VGQTITITSTTAHGLVDGDRVVVGGVTGNTSANGTWTVKVTGTTTFQLAGSAANSMSTTGGTWAVGRSRLWEQAGSGAATRMLARPAGANNLIINPGQLVSTAIGGSTYLFFVAQAQDPSTGNLSLTDSGVWSYRLGGTPGSSSAVIEKQFSQPQFPTLGRLTPSGDSVYFTGLATSVLHRVRAASLTDATPANWFTVEEVTFDGASASDVQSVVDANGTLYFTSRYGLFSVPTTASPTTATQIKQLYNDSYKPTDLVAIGARVFFVAVGPTPTRGANFGRELWTSDGTTANTVIVRDINTAIDPDNAATDVGSAPQSLLKTSSGRLYFTAQNVAGNRELWRTTTLPNGSIDAELVREINASSGSSPEALVELAGSVVLIANDGGGATLWKTGTAATSTALVTATTRVRDDLGVELKVTALAPEGDKAALPADAAVTTPALASHAATSARISATSGQLAFSSAGSGDAVGTAVRQAAIDALKTGKTRLTLRFELPARGLGTATTADDVAQDNVRLDIQTHLVTSRPNYDDAQNLKDAYDKGTRLVVTPPAANDVVFDLVDAAGGRIATGVTQVDWRQMDAGTYYIRVYRPDALPGVTGATFSERSFTIEMRPPAAGQTRPTFRDPDRDTLRGGDGDDFLIGNADIDALFGDSGRDTFTSDVLPVYSLVQGLLT